MEIEHFVPSWSTHMHNTRREFLILAGSAAFIAAAAPHALSRAPFAGAIQPSYRLKLGDFEATALANGYLNDEQKLYTTHDNAQISKLPSHAFPDASTP